MSRHRLVLVVAALVLPAAPPGFAGSSPGWAPTHVAAGVTYVRGVMAFPDGTGYVQATDFVTPAGYVVRTTDGGLTWAQRPAAPGTLFMTSATSGYALGPAGEVWATTDGAATWARTGTRPPLPAVSDGFTGSDAGPGGPIAFAVSPTTGGNECGALPGAVTTVVTSGDGGQSWQTATLATTGAIADISFADAEHGLVTVQQFATTACATATTAKVWVTRDGGATFRLAYTCAIACHAEMVSRSRIVVAEQVEDDTFSVVTRSEDGGRTFRRGQALRTLPLGDDLCTVHDLAFASNDLTGYAATQACGIWRTADGGLTWSNEPTGPGLAVRVGAFDATRAVAATSLPSVVWTRTA